MYDPSIENVFKILLFFFFPTLFFTLILFTHIKWNNEHYFYIWIKHVSHNIHNVLHITSSSVWLHQVSIVEFVSAPNHFNLCLSNMDYYCYLWFDKINRQNPYIKHSSNFFENSILIQFVVFRIIVIGVGVSFSFSKQKR